MRPGHLLTIAAVAAGFVVVLAVALVLMHVSTSERPGPTRSQPESTIVSPPTVAGSQSQDTVDDKPLLVALRKFAAAYSGYLDGEPATVLTHAASVTAIAQATDAGQIPPAFRDGALRITQVDALESSCCSGSVTVVLANREERYPFDEQLLLEQHGWVVDQITPPDLSIDRNLRPAPHVATRPFAAAAARTFAVAYVDYRSGESSRPPAMNAAAAKQIHAGTDSLAGQTLPKAPARLTSIQFGPPSGEEFAATANVRAGHNRVTFSFLMVRTVTGWKCGQYL